MTPPCKDCQDRTPGCHAKCEKYAVFRIEKDKEMKKRVMDAEVIDCITRTVRRIEKRTRKGRG